MDPVNRCTDSPQRRRLEERLRDVPLVDTRGTRPKLEREWKAVEASEWSRSDVSAAVVSCMSVSVRSFRSTKSRPPPARRPLELLVACGRVETHELERVLERQVAHLAGGELGQEHASRFDRSTEPDCAEGCAVMGTHVRTARVIASVNAVSDADALPPRLAP